MTRRFKLVALVLMLVMGTLPVLASASPTCRGMANQASSAPTMHACCPSMAMTAEAVAPSHALEADNTMPCCHVAPAKPRRVDLQMPAASVELALQPANVTVSTVPATGHARCDYHIPLPDSAGIQSHLCTFLI
jgi:hypothetical protein